MFRSAPNGGVTTAAQRGFFIGVNMDTNQLSKFKPALDNEPGGIKTINVMHHVVPVPVEPDADISPQARTIHDWLITENARTNAPVLVNLIIKTHGFKHRLLDGMKTLRGFPVEELLDAGLLYVEEDRRPELENDDAD